MDSRTDLRILGTLLAAMIVSDATATAHGAQFDLDRYGQGQSKSVPFNNVGLAQIFCNIHPQMKASLLVVPNRYFARADAEGHFAIHDVPPGRYVLIGWGLRSGEQRQAI